MIKRVLLLTVVLWYQTAALGWAALTVTIAPQAIVAGPEIELGEVAAISGEPTPAISRLAALTLGPAPRPGSSMVLTPELIMMRLSPLPSEPGIEWELPVTLTVTTASQTVTGQSLTAVAAATIKQQLGAVAERPDTIIQPVRMPDDYIVPQGNIALTAQLPHGVRLNGATVVNVSISVNGKHYLNESLQYTVKVFKDVVVAARRIEAQEKLSDAHLRYQRWDIGRLPSGYLTDIQAVNGRISRRSLAAGSVIVDKNLAQPIVVERGQTVIISVQAGAITVTARGRALEAGGVGEIIRVQNLNSHKTITAKVLSDTSVQVLSV